MADATTTTTPPAVNPPMATDPLTGHKVPIYVGGDPPVVLATDEPAAAVDRGDALQPPTTTPPPAKTEGKEAAPSDGEKPPEGEKPTEGEEPERDANGRFVSKRRFNEVNERRRAAEDKLAQIEREKAAADKGGEKAYDFDASEQRYIELILDGKTADAAALRKEIRAAEAAQYEAQAQKLARQQSQATTVEERINATAKLYETTYPQFDPESPEYSEELLEDLNAVYTGLLQSKRFTNAADAFEAAITKAMKMHGIEEKAPPAKTNGETPPPARTAAKRIDAIRNQPPNIARSGTGGSEHGDANIRVAELSEAEFARLPEATRRRLRGDSL